MCAAARSTASASATSAGATQARRPARPDLARGRLEPLLAARDQPDVGAPARQLAHRRAPDARPRRRTRRRPCRRASSRRGAGGARPRACPRRTPRRSSRRTPSRSSGLRRRDEALVDHDLLVDDVAAGVADVGAHARIGGQRAAAHHVGLDQRPRAVADHADGLAGLEERLHEARSRRRPGAGGPGSPSPPGRIEPVVVVDATRRRRPCRPGTCRVGLMSDFIAWISPSSSESSTVVAPAASTASLGRSIARPARRRRRPGSRSSCHSVTQP